MFGRKKLKELEAKVARLERIVELLLTPTQESHKQTQPTEGEVSMGVIFDEWVNGKKKE